MRKIGILIIALVLIYIILINSLADINHGQGLVWLTEYIESRV